MAPELRHGSRCSASRPDSGPRPQLQRQVSRKSGEFGTQNGHPRYKPTCTCTHLLRTLHPLLTALTRVGFASSVQRENCKVSGSAPGPMVWQAGVIAQQWSARKSSRCITFRGREGLQMQGLELAGQGLYAGNHVVARDGHHWDHIRG